MLTDSGKQNVDVEANPEPTDLDKLVIRITFDGSNPTWVLQEQPVTEIEQISDQLATLGEISTDVPVILWPEKSVPLQHVVAAFDAANANGYSKISYAISGDN